MYVVVRADLRPGLAAAQAVHAAVGLAESGARPPRGDAGRVIVLACPGEADVVALADRAGPGASLFREPDLGGQATAVAFHEWPELKTLVRRLPLWCGTVCGPGIA